MTLTDRGVRLVLESGRPIKAITRDLGVGREALRKGVRRVGADSGACPDVPTTQEREEIRRLRQENYDLRERTRFETELDLSRTR